MTSDLITSKQQKITLEEKVKSDQECFHAVGKAITLLKASEANMKILLKDALNKKTEAEQVCQRGRNERDKYKSALVALSPGYAAPNLTSSDR